MTFSIFSVSGWLAFKFLFSSIPESSGNDFPIQRTWIVLAFFFVRSSHTVFHFFELSKRNKQVKLNEFQILLEAFS